MKNVKYKPISNKYTPIIIQEFRDWLNETRDSQTTIDTLDICHLLGEIDRLTKELQKEKNIRQEAINYITDHCDYYVDIDGDFLYSKCKTKNLLKLLKR